MGNMSYINTLTEQYSKHLSSHGITVLIDGVQHKAFFKEYDDKRNSHDHKYIFCDMGAVNQGSIVKALGYKWISTAHIENYNNVYEKSLIRQIKFSLLHKESATVIPCIIDTGTQNVRSGQFVSLPIGLMEITVQENEQNKIIKIDDILFVANQKLKVVGIDYSKIGLLTLYAEIEQFSTGETPIWDASVFEPQEPPEEPEPEEPTDPGNPW